MKRRKLLDWFLGTSLGAMFGSIAYPVVRYLVPPALPEAPTTRVVAAREGELKSNEAKVFPFGARPAILIRLGDGGYRAFDAGCTHLNCTVQFRGELQRIWCACHNGFYDMTGRNVAGPPPRPLEAFQVNVVAGEIVVTRT